jgi:hypothetical protein
MLSRHFELTVNDSAERTLGVSQANEPDCIIVTFESAVAIYRLTDQQCLRRWSAPLSEPLTCITVQHPISGRYFGVLSAHKLVSWAADDTAVSWTSAVSFPTPIHSLVTLATLNNTVAVVLNNGVVLSSDNPSVESQVEEKVEEILWSGALALQPQYYASYLCRTLDAYQLRVFWPEQSAGIELQLKQSHILCAPSTAPSASVRILFFYSPSLTDYLLCVVL